MPNAISGRDNIVDAKVIGMEGVPEADMIAHNLQNQGRTSIMVTVVSCLMILVSTLV